MSINLNGHERPVDKMAAMSYSKGEGYNLNASFAQTVWENQPKIKEFPGPAEHNLVGTKFGRLEVIGYLDKSNLKQGCLWCVRCRCGMYETRRTRSIKRAITGKSKELSRCQSCEIVEHRRKRYVFNNTGKWDDKYK